MFILNVNHNRFQANTTIYIKCSYWKRFKCV